MEEDDGLDHFDIEIADDSADIQLSLSETAANDQINVQLPENGATSPLAPDKSDQSNFKFSKNGMSAGGHESDLLRASLSDVVLSQSLQFTEKSIDFEDGKQTSVAQLRQSFDSVVPDKKTFPDMFSVEQKGEFTDLCAEKTVVTPAQPESTEEVLAPLATAFSDKPGGDIADFEDADNHPLLTSTLKADTKEEDSDDEFGFDVPASKADNGKSVTFSGGGEGALDHTKDKAVSAASQVEKAAKGADKVQLEESSGVAAATAKTVPAISEAVVVPQAEPPSQQTKVTVEESSEERQDRSHIITSSAADWDNVETVEAGYGESGTGQGGEPMSSVPPLLSFSDVWQHVRSTDHVAVKDNIQVTVEKNGFAGVISRLFGPPSLSKDLHTERELVFCIAATALENRDSQHCQCLQTVYRVLTGSRFNCQRYGSHWEEIGFQGRDPATDLRGVGMLALVLQVSFLRDDSTAQISRDLYKLSLHPTQNFPFCVMCINITRICLQSLREGLLNRECNRQRSVIPVVNQFYAGCLLNLYRLWKPGKTIADSGFVIRDVETRAKKKTKEVFRDLQAYQTAQKAKRDVGGSSMPEMMEGGIGGGGGDAGFFNVVKSDTKTAAELY